MNPTTFYLLTFAGALLFSFVITGLYRNYALTKGVIDHPNERSSHKQPTPRGGGISIVIVCSLLIVLGALFDQLDSRVAIALLCSGLMVAAVGLIDDHRPISSPIRLSVHIIASLSGLLLLPALPGLHLGGTELPLGAAGIGLLTVALAWLINLYNFMDGIDGIASIEAMAVLVGAAAILSGHSPAESHKLVLLIAPIAGFLIWNWSPAKIFMGDGCSGYLGMLLGLLATHLASISLLNLWCWAILLGAFIVDSSWTLMIRIISRQSWHQPHRSHCYQILARELNSHARVSLTVAAATLFWLTPLAAIASFKPYWGPLLLIIGYSPIIYLCARKQAGYKN